MAYSQQTALDITESIFGNTPAGDEVKLFTLVNAQGITVKIINFGGVITEIHTPDRNGKLADIVLGFDYLEPYLNDSPYFGALIGRYGNRIANGKFSLDHKEYDLPINNGSNHLHGGIKGFDKVLWRASSFAGENSVGVILRYLSVDGEQGYPGNLQVEVIYELTNDNEICVKFYAVTDKATPINLTQHSYFNLSGFTVDHILNHQLELDADNFIPVNPAQIPTGEVLPVANTVFDFRKPEAIGSRINNNDQQLVNSRGYDHTFVLNKNRSTDQEAAASNNELSFAARVTEPVTGRVLELFTQEPGVQFYSGNFLDGSLTGKGHRYNYRSGFCLEPQHFPDSPNQPQFPNTILRPGEEYQSTTVYKFSTTP